MVPPNCAPKVFSPESLDIHDSPILRRYLLCVMVMVGIIGPINFQHWIITSTLQAAPLHTPTQITNIHNDGLKGNILFLENQNFVRVLSAKILESKKSIQIAMYLFKVSEHKSNQARQILDKLIEARKRGVNIQVILEYSDFNKTLNISNQSTSKWLKQNGINVRFDSADKQTHSKLTIIDKRFTFIGSHNFSHSALGLNNELSVMIDSSEFAARASDYFTAIQ